MRQRKPSLVLALCVLVGTCIPRVAAPDSTPPPPDPLPSGCKAEQAVTVPAQVDMSQVMSDAYALEDTKQERVFRRPDRALDQAMGDLFDLAVPKSKLEQFYTMLFFIARYASHPGDEIALDVPKALNLLLSSKVFSDPDFPRQITQIHLNRKDPANPRYQVVFDRSDVRLPLNKGHGFGVFRQGMCQHAKALIFYGSFAFSLRIKDQSLEAYDFDRVDLWGSFGSRGLIDVDINYVSVKSVEFMRGQAMGLVKAKVSRKEFEVNRHSFLLELITRFVTDKSIQPIDW